MFQIQAKDTVVRVGGYYGVVNGVQNVSWEPSMNAENLREIGNKGYAGKFISPEVSGSFDVTATGASVALLKRMIKSLDASGEFVGYEAGDPATADNAGVVRETDFDHACFDFLIQKQPNEVFDRTELLPRVFLSSVAISGSADGTATESYSFEGEVGEVYRAPYHDLQVVPIQRDTAAVDPTVTLKVPLGYEVSKPGAATPKEWTTFHLDVEGQVVPNSAMTLTRIDPDGSESATTPTTSGDEYYEIGLTGYSVAKGQKVGLVLYRSTPGSIPQIEYPTAARFVKADSISIYLVGKDVVDIEAQLDSGVDLNTINFNDSDLFLRAQSADINIDLQREALREIRKNDRGTSIYYRAATFPLNITSSISAYETDLKDWQKIQGKTDSDILDLRGFENKEWQIVLRYFYNDQVIQTTALLDGGVTGRGSSLAVGGRTEVSWQFEGSKVAIQGSNTV